ncbi:hypothetical protein ABPG77_010300 [Micractinium sp. CCAP 211/92]
MASFSGLLELRGPRGHTVLDLPPGVLEAARQTVPPAAFPSFVAKLLSLCSDWAGRRRPITLHHLIMTTALFDCPGVSRDHLLAFERQVWPRHATIAQLAQYSGFSPWVPTLLKDMDPKLRQLVEAVFAQESEWVRVAVLQHLLDNCGLKLVCAPRSIELALTGEAPSRTIPDDPRLHQLLRQLHAEVHAELRRQGKEVKVQDLPPAVPSAGAQRQETGSGGSLDDGSPGTPSPQDGGNKNARLAAGSARNCGPASCCGQGAAADGAADCQQDPDFGTALDGAQRGLRHRRHERPAFAAGVA